MQSVQCVEVVHSAAADLAKKYGKHLAINLVACLTIDSRVTIYGLTQLYNRSWIGLLCMHSAK